MDRSRPTTPTMKVECIGCGATMEVAQPVQADAPDRAGEDPLSLTFNEVDIDHPVIYVTQCVCSEACKLAVKEAFAP